MSSEMTSREVGRFELQSNWLRYRSLLSTDAFLLVSHKILVVVSGKWRVIWGVTLGDDVNIFVMILVIIFVDSYLYIDSRR